MARRVGRRPDRRAVLEDTEAALRKSAGWYADLAGQVLAASVLR